MSMQMVELLYASPPSYDGKSIADHAESILSSGVQAVKDDAESGTLLFAHKAHPVEYATGKVPAQTAILPTDRPPTVEDYVDEIQQSWSCENPEELIGQCSHTRLLTEMMAQGLEPETRLDLFHGMLKTLVQLTQPVALAFKHTQQIVSSQDYLESCDQPPIQRHGGINVRFYRISNSENEEDIVMDTRGMEEIGLHDLQCHYRNLDPNQVGAVLYNTAFYIVENGAVIESGHTIGGATPDSVWTCQFEESLLEPQRDLLDLNPGPPHAAGNRSE